MEALVNQFCNLHSHAEREHKALEMESFFREQSDVKYRHEVSVMHPLTDIGTDCGAIVMLGMDHSLGKIVVIKDYIHEDGQWLVPQVVWRQLEVYYKILTEKNLIANEHLQRCLDIQIGCSKTRFILKYYPFDFKQILQRSTPKNFVFDKVIELVSTVRLLHECHIAHRDVKIQNVCFDKKGKLILIDFDSSISNEVLTARKTLPVCTFTTRPPEHFVCKEYDARCADWWSVGCVVAQMYTGEEVFQVSNADAVDSTAHCARMQQFSSAWGTSVNTSEHPMVKLLRRCIPQREVIVLLQRLFHLDPVQRLGAADFFLADVLGQRAVWA